MNPTVSKFPTIVSRNYTKCACIDVSKPMECVLPYSSSIMKLQFSYSVADLYWNKEVELLPAV